MKHNDAVLYDMVRYNMIRCGIILYGTVSVRHDLVRRTQLHSAGAKVLMVNTDGPAWGGRLSDLDDVVVSTRDPPLHR